MEPNRSGKPLRKRVRRSLAGYVGDTVSAAERGAALSALARSAGISQPPNAPATRREATNSTASPRIISCLIGADDLIIAALVYSRPDPAIPCRFALRSTCLRNLLGREGRRRRNHGWEAGCVDNEGVHHQEASVPPPISSPCQAW